MFWEGGKNLNSYERIVVGVDPSVTHHERSDECGIIVAGRRREGIAVVLDDLSLRAGPLEWGRRVVEAYHHYQADRVVAEVNMGGDLVETLLKTLDPLLSFRGVRASRGKIPRAEPIAALYESGKVYHARCFEVLENQMCSYVPGAFSGKSPDRMDALVWALTDLMLMTSSLPRVWEI